MSISRNVSRNLFTRMNMGIMDYEKAKDARSKRDPTKSQQDEVSNVKACLECGGELDGFRYAGIFCEMECFTKFIENQDEVSHPSFLTKPYLVHPDEYDVNKYPTTCGVNFIRSEKGERKIRYCNARATTPSTVDGRYVCYRHKDRPNMIEPEKTLAEINKEYSTVSTPSKKEVKASNTISETTRDKDDASEVEDMIPSSKVLRRKTQKAYIKRIFPAIEKAADDGKTYHESYTPVIDGVKEMMIKKGYKISTDGKTISW